MRVQVRELAALKAVPPENAAMYLAARGWHAVEERATLFTIWANPKFSHVRILVPSSQAVGDYALRIQQLLESLEIVEDRSQAEILTDLFVPYADILRVRHTAMGDSDSSITLDAGVELVANARRLVLAAASAAVAIRSTYATRKPDSAEGYIKKVRMAHTERGSFILTILSPIFISDSLFRDSLSVPEPFERRVTRTLLGAVDAAVTAALESERRQDLSPFKSTLEKGVSSNLCDALVGLEAKTNAIAIDLSVSWAPGRELPRPDVPTTVRIPRKVIPVLEAASRELKNIGPEPVLVRGPITHLHSDFILQQGAPESAGDITVAGYIDGELRKVNITLPMAEYLRAVEGHKLGQLINVRGELEKQGRAWVLLNLHDLQFEDF
jgi:hypothetical protein